MNSISILKSCHSKKEKRDLRKTTDLHRIKSLFTSTGLMIVKEKSKEKANKRRREKTFKKATTKNEFEIRFRQSKWRARNSGFSANASVILCAFLFRHGNYLQNRHSSLSVHHHLLNKLGEPTSKTRRKENAVTFC
jgi:hypothetical protein